MKNHWIYITNINIPELPKFLIISKLKLITQKNAEEAFEAFKNNAMNKYTNITSIEIAKETITQK